MKRPSGTEVAPLTVGRVVKKQLDCPVREGAPGEPRALDEKGGGPAIYSRAPGFLSVRKELADLAGVAGKVSLLVQFLQQLLFSGIESCGCLPQYRIGLGLEYMG